MTNDINHTQPFAVIDIGSNSIRLVIFKALSRHPIALIDDSVMCRLGETEPDGALKESSMCLAQQTIQRFTIITEQLHVNSVHLFATAAVREAPNQSSFLEKIASICPHPLRILSGEEEAYFSALGVLSAFGLETNGIVSDLGGASMELIHLQRGVIKQRSSLNIGPLSLGPLPSQKHSDFIKKSLAAAPSLSEPAPLFLVGGSARAIAKLYMKRTQYPFEAMHGYQIPTAQLKTHLIWLEQQSPELFKNHTTRIKKRRHLLPLAAKSILALLNAYEPTQVVFSGYGLREGFAYSLLSSEDKEKDLLLTSCQTILSQENKFLLEADAMVNWIFPLIAHCGFASAQHKRLLSAVCTLSDCGWGTFSEYRAEYAFKKILHNPWLMATHEERLCIALTLFLRYNGSLKCPYVDPISPLIPSKTIKFAKAMATSLQIYYALLDGVPSTCTLFPYQLTNDTLHMHIAKGLLSQEQILSLKKCFSKELELHLSISAV